MTNIVMALVAAGLSLLVAIVAARIWRERRGFVILAAGVSFLVFNTLLGMTLSPVLDRNRAEKSVLEVSFIRAIRDHYPEDYRRQVLPLIEEHAARELTTDEIAAKTQAELMPFLFDRFPLASDEAVSAYFRVAVAAGRTLHKKDPILCYNWLNPAANDSSYVNAIPDDQLQEMSDVLAVVVKSSAQQPQTIPDEEEIISDLLLVYGQVSELYGSNVWMLADPNNPDVDKGTVCLMTIDMLEEISKLPEEDGSALWRYLMSDQPTNQASE